MFKLEFASLYSIHSGSRICAARRNFPRKSSDVNRALIERQSDIKYTGHNNFDK